MSKILVVDDDKALTKAIAVRLQSAGFSVVVQNCAHDASSSVVQCLPDLIILDVDMPGYTGLEFHHCLQFSSRARDIPVVYLSGRDCADNRRIAFEQGAVAFLTKPFDSNDLVVSIKSILELQSAGT